MSFFERLKGKTIRSVLGLKKHSKEVVITVEGNQELVMNHFQCCYESVLVSQIDGDINDIIGETVTMAEESIVTGSDGPDYHWTATFYKLATRKGYLTFTWNGQSNGYYSERVDLEWRKTKVQTKFAPTLGDLKWPSLN